MDGNWFDIDGLKCVVLCAGEGRRIGAKSAGKPKVMIEAGGRPILGHVVDYWRRFASDFVFVVGYRKEQVIEYARGLRVKAEFVEQSELRGIADAISRVESLVGKRFIVVLGDCLCHGNFSFPPAMQIGVGVCHVDDADAIKRSYSLDVEGEMVTRVEEKPREIHNDLCGMGFYFFDRRVFEYIEMTKPSSLRGEVEITDVIQRMIDSGEKICTVLFRGEYLNVTYAEDLPRAEELVSKQGSQDNMRISGKLGHGHGAN